MKKRTISILILLTGLFTACNDEFLDVAPRDQLSDATFWRNQDDAIAAATGVYDYWSSRGNGELETKSRALYLADDWSDDAITTGFWNGFWYNTWGLGNISPQDGMINSYWKGLYQVIRRANVFLTNIDKPEMDETMRKQLAGEVRFIRAWEYFSLWKTWGDVPVVDRPLDVDELNLSRAEAGKTLEFILSDLNTAIADLAVNPSQAGRITKGAALALKARVQLYAGNYQDAANSAKAVIDSGVYELFQTSAGDGYKQQFITANNNNVESIVAWQYKDPERGNEKPGLFQWTNLTSPTKALFDTYIAYDSNTDQLISVDANDEFANRDPRLSMTLEKTGWKNSSTGYDVNKFNGGDAGTANILIRYAEVLLTYAEAKIEMNDIDASVVNAINAVRARAFGVNVIDTDNYPEVVIDSQERLREIVRAERRVELAMEGLRWDDVKRWNIGATVMNGNVLGIKLEDGSYKVAGSRSFDAGRDYLRPIPQQQIDLSNGALVQNPGYN
ncbi:RagB/SusD family nutrient uptake outer membrane protein [Puteibacter caeruleilacunae]|nr:RagB/SusD family nutrient uptake outer membrane protein [Puteibacter caeruleilacunae]